MVSDYHAFQTNDIGQDEEDEEFKSVQYSPLMVLSGRVLSGLTNKSTEDYPEADCLYRSLVTYVCSKKFCETRITVEEA